MKSAESTDLLGAALCGAFEALTDHHIDALVVGGIAISYHLSGRPEVDHDVDLFIREPDVDEAIDVLERAGFEVVRTHPSWLFKARLEGALVDVLYNLGRVLAFDDEMMARSSRVAINGCTLKLVSREDLVIAQAGASSSEVPVHWFQAVDLLRTHDVDWEYLRLRGAAAPDLFAALLYYARHAGIDVPDEIMSGAGVLPGDASK